jgi:hypothetical protein
MAAEFLLKKRGKVWRYRLRREKTFHTTGKRRKDEVTRFAVAQADKAAQRPVNLSIGEYAEPFYDWDRCPHVAIAVGGGEVNHPRHHEVSPAVFLFLNISLSSSLVNAHNPGIAP